MEIIPLTTNQPVHHMYSQHRWGGGGIYLSTFIKRYGMSVRDRICCVSVRYDVGVFPSPEGMVLPRPPHPTPRTDRTADWGEGGWRVVYSTRTASRVHVLFFPCVHVLS